MAHVETAVMAQNARTDVFFLALHELCDPFGICQELSCESCAVDFAFRDRFRRNCRVHTPRAYDRNIHEVPDVFHVFEVAVFRHVDRRMRPVPRVIGAIVAV